MHPPPPPPSDPNNTYNNRLRTSKRGGSQGLTEIKHMHIRNSPEDDNVPQKKGDERLRRNYAHNNSALISSDDDSLEDLPGAIRVPGMNAREISTNSLATHHSNNTYDSEPEHHHHSEAVTEESLKTAIMIDEEAIDALNLSLITI